MSPATRGSLSQTLASILSPSAPVTARTIPVELSTLAFTLLSTSRCLAPNLKPTEEPARETACCFIAIKRLQASGELKKNKARGTTLSDVKAPCSKQVFNKLVSYLEAQLPKFNDQKTIDAKRRHGLSTGDKDDCQKSKDPKGRVQRRKNAPAPVLGSLNGNVVVSDQPTEPTKPTHLMKPPAQKSTRRDSHSHLVTPGVTPSKSRVQGRPEKLHDERTSDVKAPQKQPLRASEEVQEATKPSKKRAREEEDDDGPNVAEDPVSNKSDEIPAKRTKLDHSNNPNDVKSEPSQDASSLFHLPSWIRNSISSTFTDCLGSAPYNFHSLLAAKSRMERVAQLALQDLLNHYESKTTQPPPLPTLRAGAYRAPAPQPAKDQHTELAARYAATFALAFASIKAPVCSGQEQLDRNNLVRRVVTDLFGRGVVSRLTFGEIITSARRFLERDEGSTLRKSIAKLVDDDTPMNDIKDTSTAYNQSDEPAVAYPAPPDAVPDPAPVPSENLTTPSNLRDLRDLNDNPISPQPPSPRRLQKRYSQTTNSSIESMEKQRKKAAEPAQKRPGRPKRVEKPQKGGKQGKGARKGKKEKKEEWAQTCWRHVNPFTQGEQDMSVEWRTRSGTQLRGMVEEWVKEVAAA